MSELRCKYCDRLIKVNSKKICRDCELLHKDKLGDTLCNNIPFVRVLSNLLMRGNKYAPRNQRIIEIQNYTVDINYPFSSVKDREMNLEYIKREFQWYLHRDIEDDRITKYAKMWKVIRQPNGTFSSNYGQYMFGYFGGFQWVVDTLKDDPDSRQAIIPFAHAGNLYKNNPDQICTVYILFNIRNDKLNMFVAMRSQDIFFGFANDIPIFWWFHEMVTKELNIEKGKYTHFVNSMHIYEKHYDKMISILDNPQSYLVEYPPITNAYDLIHERYESDFGCWLREVKL